MQYLVSSRLIYLLHVKIQHCSLCHVQFLGQHEVLLFALLQVVLHSLVDMLVLHQIRVHQLRSHYLPLFSLRNYSYP